MKLVIAEKPSVAQSIAKVIGANERGEAAFFLLYKIARKIIRSNAICN